MMEWLAELCWLLPLLGVSFGSSGGGGSQSQTSVGVKGLQPNQNAELSGFIGPAVEQTYLPALNTALTTPFQMPSLNSMGVYNTQGNALDQLLAQNTSTASGNLAKRGFLNPNDTPLAAQQGVQSFLPQYLQTVGQNIQAQQLIPEWVRQQNFQDLANAYQQLIALLGSSNVQQSSGGDSQSKWNFGILS